jgi:hypothetical protein
MGQVLIVVFFRGTGTPVLPMLKMPASSEWRFLAVSSCFFTSGVAVPRIREHGNLYRR